jgi:mRNA-degrading endonuclease HigB of HigAB toxin-antitoxin module
MSRRKNRRYTVSTKSIRRKNRRYTVAEVMHHYPHAPNDLNELVFIIRWEGYDDPSEYTEERWNTNNSLHKNRVVLSYMLNKQQLRGLINFFIEIPRSP